MEDSWLEAAYEDRFIADTDIDEGEWIGPDEDDEETEDKQIDPT